MADIRSGGSVTVEMAAEPLTVYELVSDVTRIGEWSPECRRAKWLGDDEGPVVGARFKGHNRWKLNRWARICEVTDATPGEAFEFRTVPGRGPSADSSTWRYEIQRTESGSRVTESYQITKMPHAWFQPIIKRFMAHHLDMRPHMQQTLEALRAEAERLAKTQ
jgi:hypothetical protein